MQQIHKQKHMCMLIHWCSFTLLTAVISAYTHARLGFLLNIDLLVVEIILPT